MGVLESLSHFLVKKDIEQRPLHEKWLPEFGYRNQMQKNPTAEPLIGYKWSSLQLPCKVAPGWSKTTFTITVERSWLRAIVKKVKDHKNDVTCNVTLSNPRHVEGKISPVKTIANFWNVNSDEFPNFEIGALGESFKEELVEMEEKAEENFFRKRKPVLGSQRWKITSRRRSKGQKN